MKTHTGNRLYVIKHYQRSPRNYSTAFVLPQMSKAVRKIMSMKSFSLKREHDGIGCRFCLRTQKQHRSGGWMAETHWEGKVYTSNAVAAGWQSSELKCMRRHDWFQLWGLRSESFRNNSCAFVENLKCSPAWTYSTCKMCKQRSLSSIIRILLRLRLPLYHSSFIVHEHENVLTTFVNCEQTVSHVHFCLRCVYL